MSNVICFLQNAWSPVYAGGRWPRASWLRALWKSRSGQRLRVLQDAAGKSFELWFDNTTPIVGDTPDSVIAPDESHIRAVLAAHKASAIITLGLQAGATVPSLVMDETPMLILPHPSWRLVSNQLYRSAGHMLRNGFEGRKAIIQKRGGIKIEEFDPQAVLRFTESTALVRRTQPIPTHSPD